MTTLAIMGGVSFAVGVTVFVVTSVALQTAAMKARTSLILGKKELMDGTILMRDMDSGAQETVVFKKIRERLSKKDRVIEKKFNNRKEGGLYGGL